MAYDLIFKGGNLVNKKIIMQNNNHTRALPEQLLRGKPAAHEPL